MKRIQTLAFASLILAAFAISFTVQYRANARLRVREETLNRQAELQDGLVEENQRLSNLVVQARNAQPLSKEQLHELLRLRSQIRELREAGLEKSRLQMTNAQLKITAAEIQFQITQAQADPNYIAKERLVPTGFADPVSAMKSMLWGMNSGEVGAMWDHCTPEARANLEKEWGKHGTSEADRAAEMKAMSDAMVSASAGFIIVDQKSNSPDEVAVKVSFVGEGANRTFVFRKTGNEWQFHNLIFAGEEQR